MATISDLQKEIDAIKERNSRVELDKAWETSKTRTVAISLMTYVVIGLFLWVSGISHPWLNAIIPAAAFFLSTMTLPFIKRFWIKRYAAR